VNKVIVLKTTDTVELVIGMNETEIYRKDVDLSFAISNLNLYNSGHYPVDMYMKCMYDGDEVYQIFDNENLTILGVKI